MQEVICEGT